MAVNLHSLQFPVRKLYRLHALLQIQSTVNSLLIGKLILSSGKWVFLVDVAVELDICKIQTSNLQTTSIVGWSVFCYVTQGYYHVQMRNEDISVNGFLHYIKNI